MAFKSLELLRAHSTDGQLVTPAPVADVADASSDVDTDDTNTDDDDIDIVDTIEDFDEKDDVPTMAPVMRCTMLLLSSCNRFSLRVTAYLSL